MEGCYNREVLCSSSGHQRATKKVKVEGERKAGVGDVREKQVLRKDWYPNSVRRSRGGNGLRRCLFIPQLNLSSQTELAGSHVTGKLEMMRWRTSPFRSYRLQPHRLLPPLPDAEPGDSSGRGPP